MNSRKSKSITLLFVTGMLAACENKPNPNIPLNGQRANVYMRGDTTAPYHHVGNGHHFMFYPMGYFNSGTYHSAGYSSNILPDRANYGTNYRKAPFVSGYNGSTRTTNASPTGARSSNISTRGGFGKGFGSSS